MRPIMNLIINLAAILVQGRIARINGKTCGTTSSGKRAQKNRFPIFFSVREFPLMETRTWKGLYRDLWPRLFCSWKREQKRAYGIRAQHVNCDSESEDLIESVLCTSSSCMYIITSTLYYQVNLLLFIGWMWSHKVCS